MRILHPSLSLGSFTANTEAKAHPGGDRSPRDAGPWPLGAGTPHAAAPAPASRRACASQCWTAGPATPSSPPGLTWQLGACPRHPALLPDPPRAPPPLAYLYPQVGSRACLRCARSCPSVGSAWGISSGQVRFWSRTRSFMAATGGPRGRDPEAATVTTARPVSSRLKRRQPRSGDCRSYADAEM